VIRDRYLDAVHRRPAGLPGRLQYGGERGAPKDHEADFARVLEWLGPLEGDRCLELGCGGGAMLERVLAAGAASAAALDHSPDMLALAMARNLVPVELKLGDATQIPWPDASFTAAYAVNMFFFLDRPEVALAELFRVLEPGGRLVIATLAGPLPPASLRTWRTWLFGHALHAHSEEEMAVLYRAAGFADVRVETIGGRQLSRGFHS
jgi:ubiquinone/menaquinone biosynthesis C-methylase UbiE